MEVRQSQPLISEASVLDCHLDPILFVMFFYFLLLLQELRCPKVCVMSFQYNFSKSCRMQWRKQKQKQVEKLVAKHFYRKLYRSLEPRTRATCCWWPQWRSQFLTQGKNRVCGSPRSQRSTCNSYNITTGSILDAKKMSLASAARYTWLTGMQAAHERSLFPAQSLHDRLETGILGVAVSVTIWA